MSAKDGKDIYREKVATVRQRMAALPESSPLRAAIPQSILAESARRIERADAADLAYEPWPPVVNVLSEIADAAVAELDNDLALVRQHKTGKDKDVTQFLRTAVGQRVAEWYGGLFDVWARASVLKTGCEVELDAPLSNGRDSDMRAKIGGRHLRLENTVIGEADEDRQSFDNFMAGKTLDPAVIWARPGKFDQPDARGPSPYYNTLRLYAKVYDKIAQNLDPDKSQLAENEPNILLVSFSGASVHPWTPGWGWALDELFDDQPSMGGRIVRAPHLTDISLDAWIMFHAETLVSSRKISKKQFDARMDDYQRIISAPRRLGGILIFKNCTLATARINYNATDACRITHAEMAELERVFTTPCGYAL